MATRRRAPKVGNDRASAHRGRRELYARPGGGVGRSTVAVHGPFEVRSRPMVLDCAEHQPRSGAGDSVIRTCLRELRERLAGGGGRVRHRRCRSPNDRGDHQPGRRKRRRRIPSRLARALTCQQAGHPGVDEAVGPKLADRIDQTDRPERSRDLRPARHRRGSHMYRGGADGPRYGGWATRNIRQMPPRVHFQRLDACGTMQRRSRTAMQRRRCGGRYGNIR